MVCICMLEKEQHIYCFEGVIKVTKILQVNICIFISNTRLCFMYALTERLGCFDLLCFLGHYSEG
jgi:hypothetical protein